MGHFARTAPTHRAQHGDGLNARIAVKITGGVGTMACAYVFALIALISLPAAIASGSVIVIVSWIAQTFFQLVLLSVILVGQNVAAKANDAQTAHIASGIDAALDRLDEHTDGGIKTILDRYEVTRVPRTRGARK
jgi:hypothetical protein